MKEIKAKVENYYHDDDDDDYKMRLEKNKIFSFSFIGSTFCPLSFT